MFYGSMRKMPFYFEICRKLKHRQYVNSAGYPALPWSEDRTGQGRGHLKFIHFFTTGQGRTGQGQGAKSHPVDTSGTKFSKTSYKHI